MFGFPLVQKFSTPVLITFLDRIGLYLNTINIILCDIHEDIAWCILKLLVCKKKPADIVWEKYLFLFLDRVLIWLSMHASLSNIAKWLSYHACKCDLNWNIIMRSGYIRLVRVRQLLYWNCQCEQIIFEVRSNISLSVLVFSANFVADAVMDKGESAGVFAQLHGNWKWYDLGRRTWGRTSKFSKQLHGKWIQFPVINLKNYYSMKRWTLCSKYAKRIFSTCSF